ncbi:MAG: hypothetical protein AAFR16_05210 [Pseudomonadota bacterium]
MMGRRRVLSGLAASPLGALAAPGPAAGARLETRWGFNDADIDWRLYGSGLHAAGKARAPVFALFHALSSRDCLRYRPTFYDAGVAADLRAFVCVLVDVEAQTRIHGLFERRRARPPAAMVLTPDGARRAALFGPVGPETLRAFLARGLARADIRPRAETATETRGSA